MLIHATHTADGRELSPEERDAAGTPFLAWIDSPAGPEVDVGDSAFCPVRGWVVTTSGEAPSVAATVGPHRQLLAIKEARPDVVRRLSGTYGGVEERCGFADLVDLRGIDSNPAAVVVEVNDGTYAARAEFSITHAEQPPPKARADYKSVWNAAATDVEHAKLAVSGFTDEAEYRRLADFTVKTLQETVGINPDDVVLEIGAGVGRVGPSIAPLCKTWIATDVSENMLTHARERCRGLDNVETVALNGWDLSPIPSESVDVVYCTVVFMHLDEWDRFGYVREAMRVLRPGGRIHIDNFNLLSEPGWAFFMETLESYHPLERPPNVSKSSTPSELRTYLERAGFLDVQVMSPPEWMWIIAFGHKAP